MLKSPNIKKIEVISENNSTQYTYNTAVIFFVHCSLIMNDKRNFYIIIKPNFMAKVLAK